MHHRDSQHAQLLESYWLGGMTSSEESRSNWNNDCQKQTKTQNIAIVDEYSYIDMRLVREYCTVGSQQVSLVSIRGAYSRDHPVLTWVQVVILRRNSTRT